jgi:hypothetical protein
VVAKYPERLVGALEKSGLAIQADEDDGSKPVSLTKEPPPPKYLSGPQLEILEQTGRWAKEKGATWLSEFSHRNVGWEVAYANGLQSGRPAQAIDLHLAMQQLAEDDAWLSAELTDEEHRTFSSVDDEAGTDW